MSEDRPRSNPGLARALDLRFLGLALVNRCTARLFPRRFQLFEYSVFPPTFDRWLAAQAMRSGTSKYRLELWRRACRPGTLVIDVGANIGAYTLVAATAVGRSGSVLAVEPRPDLAASLRTAIEHSGLEHVSVVEAAALERSAPVRLRSTRGHGGDQWICPSAARGVTVRGVTIDELAIGPHSVSAVKIDVQGAEGRVIEGMQDLLELHASVEVFIEYWPAGLRRAGSNPRIAMDLLRRHQFSPLLIDARGRRCVPVGERFFDRADRWRIRHADLLLTRNPDRWLQRR
jgi:FkbM family methyltransferase